MSSTEITTCEDACNKPAFPLPPELRIKVYEELLIQPKHSLKPNNILPWTRSGEEHYIFTNILRTCRTFYEEALPILYGKNTLHFHDRKFSEPVLPFPEGHLTMVKRVEVHIRPFVFSSAERMGNFLMILGTSGAKLVDLYIRIHMCMDLDEPSRGCYYPLPPLSMFDQSLLGNHPIVAGLFSLKAVKKLDVQMVDEARFGPGVANALRKAFMKEGTANGRSITITTRCTVPHEVLDEENPCPYCGNTREDVFNDTANWEYKDDMFTWRAVDDFISLSRELKKSKPRKAKLVPGKAPKAKEPQTKAAATNHTTTTKQTKAKLAKASSWKAAR